MTIEVRPFRREDREQVTALVNAHVQAVVPGVSLSVNAVMTQLEREPGEFIVDPWVVERATLVAVERERVVAAAHLHRYADEQRVGESYRDAGEIRWLLCWRDAPFWPDTGAGDTLAQACLRHLESWGVSRFYADGALPAPGVYGVPDSWPHVQEIYRQAGFVHDGHIEIVLAAAIDELPRADPPPVPGITVRHELGINGTRFSALLGQESVGFIEVESDFTNGGTLSRFAGWADVGNLCVDEEHRRRGIATWLLANAAGWLRIGRVERLLTYAWPEQEDLIGFLTAAGFQELVRTKRGWAQTRPASP
jgi:GNAT superfamily N-acetyltransferase